MIDYLPMSRLINIMSPYNFFYIIKYSNGDCEVVSKKSKEIGSSAHEYNKHFYFKKDDIYYWESIIHLTSKNNITMEILNVEVQDLYKIELDSRRINFWYEKMYDDLLDELGPEYSEELEKRINILFDKLATNSNNRPFSYTLHSVPEINLKLIPNKLKRTKIDKIYSLYIDLNRDTVEWNYNIQYHLLNMVKV